MLDLPFLGWRSSLRRLAVVFLVLLFPFQGANAQSFKKIDLASRVYENGRPILVHLPDTYSEETRSYPVLYVLNEEDNFLWASQIVDFLSARNEIDSIIVVGLPDQGEYGRDNFPFLSQESSDPSPPSERYATFLRAEVVPYVNANYRTENSKFIVGHSMSGLFVTNLFRTDPDEFNLYIAISPSLQYAPQLIDMVEKRLNSTDRRGALYFTIGELEHVLIQKQFARMRDMLKKHGAPQSNLQVDSVPYNNHRSAAYAGLYNALSWAYRGWGTNESMPTNLGSAEGIAEHYARLSELLGYEIRPREGDLVGMAGFLLNRLDDPEGAAIGFQAELHFYPNSEEAAKGYEQAMAAIAKK